MYKRIVKQILLATIFILTVLGCKSQENYTNVNPKKMRSFDKKKFEENKGKGIIYNHPDMYDFVSPEGYLVTQFGTSFSSKGKPKEYNEEITKEFSPYIFMYTYFENGNLNIKTESFNSYMLSKIEYDENGKIIKEINTDTIFKHSFKQIHDMVLKNRNVDIYDTRQATALRHDTPDAVIKKYYQIHVITSELIEGQWYAQPNYSFIIDDATGKEWDPKVEAENNAYFKTYNGKDYTKKEWEVFEEEWYRNYRENKDKGFWDDIFPGRNKK